MFRVRVKICGIKDRESALAAVEAGADALGFVFAPSSRQVTPSLVREVVASLPPFVAAVGVFVDAPLEIVRELVEELRLSAVQLHGRETPEYLQKLKALTRVAVIKAFRVATPDDLSGVEEYPADAYLFDTKVEGQMGGTGKSFDWEILRGRSFRAPVILAGGLSPENVEPAIRIVRPYAVDVSSGVETKGRKDPAKIRAFIARVKEACL
ncbi:Phosphoribosylanthranilate isomerase [Ammonifex degensii KC4]|uniref:N-(5'-phosphoribosyl)anthranilate isomerase n=1 Tax=Ammonifex degensii (strain DSM 10501 / KC4) TaxID=429009 RepID=C9RDE8_AMMDK|nr:phosphoribosylanthranilate isomerase [Ammonifex degensii]ACX52275.1 Phosphoribosylanthranilate isomerase [Ammonifex degensii KC4]